MHRITVISITVTWQGLPNSVTVTVKVVRYYSYLTAVTWLGTLFLEQHLVMMTSGHKSL